MSLDLYIEQGWLRAIKASNNKRLDYISISLTTFTPYDLLVTLTHNHLNNYPYLLHFNQPQRTVLIDVDLLFFDTELLDFCILHFRITLITSMIVTLVLLCTLSASYIFPPCHDYIIIVFNDIPALY